MDKLGRLYAFLLVLALIVDVIALLAGFSLNVRILQAHAIIYLPFILATLSEIDNGLETEKDTFLHTAILTAAMFVIAGGISLLARQSIFDAGMGVFTLDTWNEQLAGQSQVTLTIAFFAVTLGVTPSQLVSIILQLSGPVAEESFFRVRLQDALIRIFQSTSEDVAGLAMAITSQALLFGITHFFAYQGNVPGLVSAALIGVLLGTYYYYTGNEPAIALAHLSYNMVIVAAGIWLT
jgi:membrane protease YdiL (CAAX protease family)